MVGNITTTSIVEEIALPSTNASLADSAKQYFWYKEHIRRDDTLNNILTRLNIHNRDAIDFIRNEDVYKRQPLYRPLYYVWSPGPVSYTHLLRA